MRHACVKKKKMLVARNSTNSWNPGRERESDTKPPHPATPPPNVPLTFTQLHPTLPRRDNPSRATWLRYSLAHLKAPTPHCLLLGVGRPLPLKLWGGALREDGVEELQSLPQRMRRPPPLLRALGRHYGSSSKNTISLTI